MLATQKVPQKQVKHQELGVYSTSFQLYHTSHYLFLPHTNKYMKAVRIIQMAHIQ